MYADPKMTTNNDATIWMCSKDTRARADSLSAETALEGSSLVVPEVEDILVSFWV